LRHEPLSDRMTARPGFGSLALASILLIVVIAILPV
jgi:hypothetical protein